MNKFDLMVISILAFAYVVNAKPVDMPECKCPAGMDYADFLFLRTEGGNVYRPKSGFGTFLFVNNQSRVPAGEIEKVKPIIAGEIWIDVRFTKSNTTAEITTEIVDLADGPSLSIFPDNKRAVVNVSALAKDNPTAGVLAARTRKEMLRAFSFLTGITGGGTPGGIMDVMSDMKRLDEAREEIPGELVIRFKNYLKRSGVKPYEQVTYRQACEEGWAMPPTNEWEKRVWNDVHSIPDKPMKITFDPATQKGKVTK